LDSLYNVISAVSDAVWGPWIFPNLIGVLGLSGVVAAMLRGDRRSD